jgi:hypothetical protein
MCNLLKYRKEVPLHTDIFPLSKPCSAWFALFRMQYLKKHEVAVKQCRLSFGAGVD